MNLAISKCVTAAILSNFSGHYLHNRSTLDIGVLGYIGIVQHKEHSPEVVTLTRGTPVYVYLLRAGLPFEAVTCGTRLITANYLKSRQLKLYAKTRGKLASSNKNPLISQFVRFTNTPQRIVQKVKALLVTCH